MNVNFHVRSNRLRNILVPEGTTVGKFKQHLDEVGYDVRDALVYVLTDEGYKTGDLCRYRLNADDICIFDTEECVGFIPTKEEQSHCYCCNRHESADEEMPRIHASGCKVEARRTADGLHLFVKVD